MKNIQKYLSEKKLSSIDFLRDSVAYFDSRIESRNENKTMEELLSEYIEVRKEFKLDKAN